MKTFIALTIKFLTILYCNGQTSTQLSVHQNAAKKDTFRAVINENNGIVYFSIDKGITWRNMSKGIPLNVKIGLGGLATSNEIIAIATKEYGVFVYNFKDSIWDKLETKQYVIDANIGAITHHNNAFYVGTQSKGVFVTNNNGKTWETLNCGLNSLTARRFLLLNNKLYVCTNDGFYLFDKTTNSWKLEYGENGLQVNGATMFKNSIYLATNKGIFNRDKAKHWRNVLQNQSVHNISSDTQQLYGMTYTSLLLYSKNGLLWQSMQEGLPKGLYTFNVLRQNENLFAGQWDGVYQKNKYESKWTKSSSGLPTKFAATNFKLFGDILLITTSERKADNILQPNK